MQIGPVVGYRWSRASPFSCCSSVGQLHPLRHTWSFWRLKVGSADLIRAQVPEVQESSSVLKCDELSKCSWMRSRITWRPLCRLDVDRRIFFSFPPFHPWPEASLHARQVTRLQNVDEKCARQVNREICLQWFGQTAFVPLVGCLRHKAPLVLNYGKVLLWRHVLRVSSARHFFFFLFRTSVSENWELVIPTLYFAGYTWVASFLVTENCRL